MKTPKILAVLAVTTAICTSPALANEDKAAATTASPTSIKFVKNASLANGFEIESSRLALKKSENDYVRDFAADMIEDHGETAERFEAILAKSTVKPEVAEKTLDAKHQAILDDLDKRSGAEFDKAYIQAQTNAHREAVDIFSEYAINGDDEVLKDFASETLPTLKEHKDEIAEIKSERKVKDQ